jgi:hypothetical protein
MSTHELAATAPSPGAFPPSTSRWEESRAWIGLRVDLQTTPAGDVQLQALGDHRLKIHAARLFEERVVFNGFTTRAATSTFFQPERRTSGMRTTRARP